MSCGSWRVGPVSCCLEDRAGLEAPLLCPLVPACFTVHLLFVSRAYAACPGVVARLRTRGPGVSHPRTAQLGGPAEQTAAMAVADGDLTASLPGCVFKGFPLVLLLLAGMGEGFGFWLHWCGPETEMCEAGLARSFSVWGLAPSPAG